MARMADAALELKKQGDRSNIVPPSWSLNWNGRRINVESSRFNNIGGGGGDERTSTGVFVQVTFVGTDFQARWTKTTGLRMDDVPSFLVPCHG